MKQALALLALAGLFSLSGCKEDEVAAATSSSSSTSSSQAPAPTSAAPKGSPGFKVVDQKVGTGAEAVSGKEAVVHYTGWLKDNGKKFDSSLDRGQPFKFTPGGHMVISCWDQGVVGMKVGGKRQLTCPPDMAYGSGGAGGVIPPNATLVFDVELLEVK